ncbi:MAG: WD40 repeat domain-containing serine/threonine-protein kinase [Pirellulales bacterium]
MSGSIEPHPADPSPSQVRRFGDYQIICELARGGMGVVYRARHARLQRTVALKTILDGSAASPDDLGRFRREAEAAAQLAHPHIVPVYEVGEHEGCSYYTMPLIEGGNLLARIGSLRDEPQTAARIVSQVARAVHFAHQHGLLHRDLNPANILIDEHGEPHITDFGLARLLDSPSRWTQTGVALGTPGYIAPEQIRADRAPTTAVDVYSLGAILYACLAGQPPFQDDNPVQALQSALQGDPPPLRSLNRQVACDLEIICRKALERKPERRYATAAELADDLERWLAHQPISARPPSAARRVSTLVLRYPLGTTIVAAVGVLIIAGLVQLSFTSSALNEESKSTDRAEELAYRAHLAFAEREWSAAHIDGARDSLLKCDESQRGWEWEYARNLCLSTPANQLGRFAQPLVSGGFNLAAAPDDERDDAARICAVDASGAARVWDSRGLELASIRVDARDCAPQAALSPNGEFLAIASSQKVALWEVSTQQKIWECDTPGRPRAMAFAVAGDRLGVLSFGDESTEKQPHFSLLSTDGRIVAVIRLRESRKPRESWFAFTSDHRLYFYPQPDPNHDFQGPPEPIQVHDAQSGKRLPDLPIGSSEKPGEYAAPLAICPDHQLLAGYVAVGDQQLRIRRINGKAPVKIPIEVGTPFGFTFSPNGRVLAYVTQDMNVDLVERRLRDGPPKYLSPLGGNIEQQPWILSVHLVDTTSGREVDVIRGIPGNQLRLAFSPDGRKLLGLGGAARNPHVKIAESFGIALLWDVAERQASRVLKASDQAVYAVLVTRDGQRIVTGGEDCILRVWDAKRGVLLRELTGHASAIKRLGVGEGPQQFISTSETESFAWDAESGKSQAIAVDSSAKPSLAGRSEAATPDGKRRATISSESRTIRLQTSMTGEEMLVLRGHAGSIHGLTFSPDGTQLITSDSRGFVRIWESGMRP